MTDFEKIFKNYTNVTLTKTGFSISFDNRQHAMEAFKELTDNLKEMDSKDKETPLINR